MQYVCDAPGDRTWFRIETEAEAASESALMTHAVEKYFLREMEDARATYQPTSTVSFERNIGLKAHLERSAPLFLTLRDRNGDGLATAMLPPGGKESQTFRIVIVGPGNRDPYPEHGDAIAALGAHFGLMLDRARCYPYAGG
jgi:hypothetical protein